MERDVSDLLCRLRDVEPRAALWAACACVQQLRPLLSDPERFDRGIAAVRAWSLKQQIVRPGWAGEPDEALPPPADPITRIAEELLGYRFHMAPLGEVPITVARQLASREAWGRRGLRRQLPHLYTIASSERWPLLSLQPWQIRVSPMGLQIAWDWVNQTPREDQSMLELLEARARAQRVGLDWTEFVQRAIAERAGDEAGLVELLDAAPRWWRS